jgi:hypothetical protein
MKRILLSLLILAPMFSMQSENKQVRLQKELKQTERQYFTTKIGFNVVADYFTPMYIIQPELTLAVLALQGAKFAGNTAIDYYFASKAIKLNEKNNNQ